MASLSDAITSTGQASSSVRLGEGESARWTITGSASGVGVALEKGATLDAFTESQTHYGVADGVITGPGFVRFRGIKVAGGQSSTVTLEGVEPVSVRGSAWQAWEQAAYDAATPQPNTLHLILE